MASDELQDDEDGETYTQMMVRDERRWKLADTDEDGQLNVDEFANFLHPEDSDHMKDVVILETMEDIDKDKDGKISMEEYIGE